MLKAGGRVVETHLMMAVAIAAQSAGRVGETGLRGRAQMIFVTLFPCLNPPPRFFLAPGWQAFMDSEDLRNISRLERTRKPTLKAWFVFFLL